MYSHKNELVYQGDIIRDYHFILPPLGKAYAYERGKDPIPAEEMIKTGVYPKQLISNAIVSNAIIISATCDAQRREFISACPIFTVDKITNELSQSWGENRIRNFVADLTNQKINYYLYLPAVSLDGVSLPESYVDLQVINSIPLKNISDYERILSLSDRGRHWLTYKLSNLFGRPA